MVQVVYVVFSNFKAANDEIYMPISFSFIKKVKKYFKVWLDEPSKESHASIGITEVRDRIMWKLFFFY